jgi:NTE family protein
METENSLCVHKSPSKVPAASPKSYGVLMISVLSSLLFLSACSHLRTRDQVNSGKENDRLETSQQTPVSPPHYEVPGPNVSPVPPMANQSVPPPAASPIPAIPKIGLIFGPGGAKAYGHIGFLQNLNRMKIPVYATVGIEWGAPVAALFSSKGQVNDVEWQMFKLKDDAMVKRSLLGTGEKVTNISALKDFYQSAFGGQKVEGFHHPFACPAYNIAKNQVYMMSRGAVEQLLPYCMPYPPVFKPFNRNVSGIRELKLAADYLRSQGANYVVLVNVLGQNGGRKSLTGDPDSLDSVVWSEIASLYAKPQPGIDASINIDLDQYGINDFDKKREIMQKGAELSQKPLGVWGKKLGF